MTGPRRLSAILEGWRPASGGGADMDLTPAVAVAWGDAVGPDVARRTRPGKLRDGVLTVYTASSAWSHQLTFLAPTIVAELNRRCLAAPVTRLRFTVAAGQIKAMLDGLTRKTPPARADVRSVDREEIEVDTAADDVESIVARLRRRQKALDRRRERAGLVRCDACGTWSTAPRRKDAPCETCAESARRATDVRIERVLTNAPWLRAHDVGSHVAGTSDAAYDRVKRSLLSRWEEQLFAAQRRLRRKDLLPADRVLAWSYLMLRSGMQQHVIGRAVVADVLGDAWADALVGAPAARNQEAQTTSAQKQRNTAGRVLTRRNNV